MANQRSKRHVHKYYQVLMGLSKVWACGAPDCSHFLPTHMGRMVNGKYSVCWNCAEVFILNPSNMERDNPICPDCGELEINALIRMNREAD